MRKRRTDARKAGTENVVDYRHKGVTRLNIPPAGLEARGEIAREKRIRWAYNPHLAPALRFDGTGRADDIAELIAAAGKRKLEPEEMKRLQEAFRNHEPWLEWAGKREQQWCVADPVALHIHERISTQAILKVARREDIQRDLFADPEHEYREAVQFYKHPMDWTNRMILGDSLAVMASLARREALAGKVQMIYMDPPYGIKYASNFQPEVGRRDVKDRDEDLTREPEMVKAYRDTWTLGVHSYLSYLRDRLILCKELLADTGSVFVQISDENLHRVRALMDEVFGAHNFIVLFTFTKQKGSQTGDFVPPINEYLLWFTKVRERAFQKFIQLYSTRGPDDEDGFPYCELRVTLKSIAQNQALDPIFDKWTPILAEKLAALNAALGQGVTKALRQKLLAKLELKQKREGKRAVTDADERRWRLPEKGWREWEVPFDTDPDWPQALQEALTAYRMAWQQKMDEVNACIAARADQEELVDQPLVERNRVRVSGPFTMEGVIPAEESIDAGESEESPIGGAPEELDAFDEGAGALRSEAQNTEAYLDRMIRLLREDGVRFPDNKILKFTTLEVLADGSTIHAKGTWGEGKEERQVAVIFGPQYGPLTTRIVEEGIRIAARRGFDDLIFAAFSFDAQAQVTIQEVQDPAIKMHMAQIRPDVNMGDLLTTTVSSQLFTVSGSPRTRLEREGDGQYVVHMEGVDIYDPVTNAVRSSGAEKVAAWFLDSDYDGRCFCVCQAFFPDRNAWGKLGKALGGALDEEAFAKLSGTVSLPFAPGERSRIAVKVIDPRGNEVLRVHKLGVYDT